MLVMCVGMCVGRACPLLVSLACSCFDALSLMLVCHVMSCHVIPSYHFAFPHTDVPMSDIAFLDVPLHNVIKLTPKA